MKTRNIIGFAIAALAGSFQLAPAQQPGAVKLTAVVQAPGQKLGTVELVGADGDNYQYKQKGTDTILAQPVAACKVFYIMTPADLASALTDYRSNELAAARKGLAACRTKYVAFGNLPGNPATTAALAELNCAVRQMDWGALNALTGTFPGATKLTSADKLRYQAAKVMAGVKDDAASLATLKTEVEDLIKSKAKAMDTETYAWLRYALGRVYASKVPAAELEGEITPEHRADASKAVDNFCQCVVGVHGNIWPMQEDALIRSLHILAAMPGVPQHVAKAGKVLSSKAWSDLPADYRDAVAMAHLMKNVYDMGGKDPLIDKLAESFYNTAKDRAASADEGQAEEKPAEEQPAEEKPAEPAK